MLVLTRKANEAVLIGDDIKVTVLSVDSDRIKLGIEAPKSMRVFRYETIKKVVLENQAAASVNVNLIDLANLKKNAKQDRNEK
ncbi:carbon storage regulator CsrA [Christensenella tenuis]|uniref:Translational regulator CsrA n=1 Tax=Christensenella tenuis TaxID=2763033 RepID=A0ABR7EAH8_9FIRM|nr:carbon storage regulator CsrA [Christensenella tenuis]